MTKRLAKTLSNLLLLVSISFTAKALDNEKPFSASHDEAGKWADQTLKKLTLEKKVAQLIFADIAGGYITDDNPKLQDWIRLAA